LGVSTATGHVFFANIFAVLLLSVVCQALNLQAVNMSDMQQLVLHMPGQDLASQLQLAGMPGMNLAMGGMQLGGGGPKPSRDAVVAHIKEAVKLLMHASEELQVGAADTHGGSGEGPGHCFAAARCTVRLS
jgi:hypothetical protein